MVAKCAGPTCTAMFRYLREGRVFVDDIQSPDGSAHLRYAWLCNECSERMTVVFDQTTGEACVVPLKRTTA